MNAKHICASTILALTVASQAAIVNISFYGYDQAAQNTPYYSHFSISSDTGVPGWYGSGDGIPHVVGVVNLYDSGWGFSATGNSSFHVMSRIDTSSNAPRALRSVGWHQYSFSLNTLTNQMQILMDGNVIQSGAYAQPVNWFMFNFNGFSQESLMDDFVVSYDGNVVYEQGFDSASLDSAWVVTRQDSGGYVTSGDTSNPRTGAGAMALGGRPSGIAFDLRTVPEPTTAILSALGLVTLCATRRRS